MGLEEHRREIEEIDEKIIRLIEKRIGTSKKIFEAESMETSAEPVVIRSQTETVKPMSVEEAVMQMDLLHKDFIVFTDSVNNDISVLYRRKDGNFGLIEPQRG